MIEFIPLSFWYDAPLTSPYSDRRHDPWQVYGSPTYSPVHGVPGFHQPDAQRVSAAGPPFETAFHTRMAAWRMDGKPRTARRFTVYKTALPTPEDRLLPSWSTLKPMPSRWCLGAYSAWSRAKPISGSTSFCRTAGGAARLSDAPARSLSAWPSASVSQRSPPLPWSPRLRRSRTYLIAVHRRTAAPLPHDGAERRIVAPRTLLNRPRAIAARKRTTPLID